MVNRKTLGTCRPDFTHPHPRRALNIGGGASAFMLPFFARKNIAVC